MVCNSYVSHSKSKKSIKKQTKNWCMHIKHYKSKQMITLTNLKDKIN